MSVSIRIAGNTVIPTLLAIQSKGYKINLKYIKTGRNLRDIEGIDELITIYSAEKENHSFSARDAEALLGLIIMGESRKDNWKYDSKSDPNIYQELVRSSVICDMEGNIIEDKQTIDALSTKQMTF